MSLLLLPSNTMGALTLSPLLSSPSLVVLLSVSPFSLPFSLLFPSYMVSGLLTLWRHMSGRPPPLITVYSNSDTVAQKQTHTDRHPNTHTKIICCRISRLAFPRCLLPAERHVDSKAKCQGKIFNFTCTHTHAYRRTQKANTAKTPHADSVWSGGLNVKG